MQLRNISGLKPVTIAAGLLIGNAFNALAYNDIDSFSNLNSIISNEYTSNHFKEVNANSYNDLVLRANFERHLLNWQKQTKILSSTKSIIQHPDFQAIVEMGVKVTPFIILEIEKKPSMLVWALNLIYNQKISNNQDIKIQEACKLWVKALKA